MLAMLGAIAFATAPALASPPTHAPGARAEATSERPTPAVPESAIGRDGMDDGVARATARLLVAPDPEDPSSAWVGVLIDLDPGWHTYWRNPGDTGLPTRLEWRIDGAEVGGIRWPVPEVFDEADGLFTTYGYEERVLLQSPVRLDPALAAARVVGVDAHLLICKQECIPADFSLSRSFDDALVHSPDAELEADLLAAARARVPQPPEPQGLAAEALYGQTGVRPGDRLEMAIAVHGCLAPDACDAIGPATSARFFPDAETGVWLEAGALDDRGAHAFVTELALEADEEVSPQQRPRLSGVLRWQTEAGEQHALELDLPVPWQPADAEVALLGAHWREGGDGAPGTTGGHDRAANGGAGLAMAIALALVGGLILNLMPCVLPVLAIKVFSVAELAEQDRADVVRSGVAYTAGILASMTALAAVVLGLRAAGTAVGWGFQFQSPGFIAFVSLVLVAFALNLFGAWEIRWTGGGLADVGQHSTGWRRSFFEGLLAVVLSTPCSAPFLGTAVGFAFAGPAVGVVAIFLAIGLGLASPFLLVTLVPGTAAFIPRSGAWMMELRKALGFALLATVVWLLWVVGQGGGVEAMTMLSGTLLAFSFGLWLFGALQHAGRSALAGATALAVCVVALAGMNVVGFGPAPAPAAATPEADEPAAGDAWRAFDTAAIEAELAAGRPVFVAFSADWCITCKVNERMVLARDDVQEGLDRLGFARFKADWTRRDEAIRLELARHGRAGVPLYLVYDPARPDAPTVLPEILTPGDVVEALETAAAGGVSDRAIRASTDRPDRSNRPS